MEARALGNQSKQNKKKTGPPKTSMDGVFTRRAKRTLAEGCIHQFFTAWVEEVSPTNCNTCKSFRDSQRRNSGAVHRTPNADHA